MVFGSDIEVERVSADERDCDYLISDERHGMTIYEAWDVVDREHTIALDASAPDALAEEIEAATDYEVRWPRDVEAATVVDRTVAVKERRAFYVEEPPTNVAEPIGHREAAELLDGRGIDAGMGSLEAAWFFPQRGDAGIHLQHTDEHGETYDSYQTVKNLTPEEIGLVRGDRAPSADEEQSIEELQAEIYAETTWAEFEAGIIACWIRDVTDYREIAERLDSTYQTVTNSVYHIRDKLEMRATEQRRVYPAVPEKMRPDELLWEE